MPPLIKKTRRKPAQTWLSLTPKIIVLSSTLLITQYALAAAPPTAGNDELTTPQNTPLTISPLANDTGEGLTITAVNESSTQGSTQVIVGTDKISYTPSSTASGEDVFWYQITDNEGRTNAAKVTIEVTPSTQGTQTGYPTATNDTHTTSQNTPLTISPLANDTGNGLTITAVNESSTQGSTQVIVGTNKITYTPSPQASGEDVFWYQITDNQGRTNAAKVTVTVTVNNQTAAPTAGNDNLSTTQGTPLTISPLVNDTGSGLTITAVNEYSTQGSTQAIVGTNQILYTPSSSASGADVFWYQITDNQGRTNAAKVTVAVTGEASGAYPTAGSDSYTIDKNSTNNVFDVFGNDTGSGLTFETLYAYSQQGGLTSNNNGRVQYSPPAGFVGTDEFWYSIKDSVGRTNSAKVTINVVETSPPSPPSPPATDFSLLRTGSLVNQSLTTLPLSQSFNQTPYVFAKALTQNARDLFITRVQQVANDQVSFYIQEDTSRDAEVIHHDAEDVALFATDKNRLLNSAGEVIGELGHISLPSTGKGKIIDFTDVGLSRSYQNPIVITSLVSVNDTDPAVVRVHEVTNNSFKIALREWHYQDGIHASERINYMVVEAGLHRLTADGYTLRAGEVELRTGTTKKSIDFGMKFIGDPAVFSQVMSSNGYQSVYTTQSELTERSILLGMHEESLSVQTHDPETVGYIAIGSQSVTDEKLRDASRLLSHGAMGASMSDINRVAVWGQDWWLNNQRQLTPSKLQPYMDWVSRQAAGSTPGRTPDTRLPYFGSSTPTVSGKRRSYGANLSSAWMRSVVYGKDQLRQRINFHLSQLFVVNYASDKYQYWIGQVVANYYDTLGDHAFGNFRDLLGAITFHSVMGDYLTYLGSSKAIGDAAPDENYARELMQLFTIGLWELNDDGSHQLDANGKSIPTYKHADVAEMAKIFTGLNYGVAAVGSNYIGQLPAHFAPLKPKADLHDNGPKVLFAGKPWQRTVPSGGGTVSDINMALDALFEHHNTPVYFAQRFIQYLVTSNPSPEYVSRISAVFRDNGQGVRGDIHATVLAILKDPEAKSDATHAKSGKLQEPLLRLSRLVKAFGAGLDLPKTEANGIYWWEPPAQAKWPQLPLFSPSVFNFFSPFNQPSGEMTRQGLYSPEMQKHDVATAISIPNRLADMIDNRIHRMHPNVTPAFKFNFGPELSLEGDPAKLLDHLNVLLCNGDMTDATYSRIKRSLDQNTEMDAEQRTKFAVWLVATSADAAVLK